MCSKFRPLVTIFHTSPAAILASISCTGSLTHAAMATWVKISISSRKVTCFFVKNLGKTPCPSAGKGTRVDHFDFVKCSNDGSGQAYRTSLDIMQYPRKRFCPEAPSPAKLKDFIRKMVVHVPKGLIAQGTSCFVDPLISSCPRVFRDFSRS